MEAEILTQHELKLNQRFFDAVNNGIKTFEIRKYDRDYKVGDTLRLVCVDDNREVVTVPNFKEGRDNVPLRIYACINYILTHEDFPAGIPEGYCVMAIKRTG